MIGIFVILWACVIISGALSIYFYVQNSKCKKELHKEKTRARSYLSDEKLKIVEAFTMPDGKKYFMYEDALHTPSGRALYALTVYEEFNMRCDREYLKAHVRATEVIMDSNPIKLTVLAQINQNLKERLDMALLPDHIYKLAAVVFFDETESPYSVNVQYNNKKVEYWKQHGVTLDFFLKTPLKDLIPALQSQSGNADTYFQVAEMVDDLHRTNLQEVQSKMD